VITQDHEAGLQADEQQWKSSSSCNRATRDGEMLDVSS